LLGGLAIDSGRLPGMGIMEELVPSACSSIRVATRSSRMAHPHSPSALAVPRCFVFGPPISPKGAKSREQKPHVTLASPDLQQPPALRKSHCRIAAPPPSRDEGGETRLRMAKPPASSALHLLPAVQVPPPPAWQGKHGLGDRISIHKQPISGHHDAPTATCSCITGQCDFADDAGALRGGASRPWHGTEWNLMLSMDPEVWEISRV
jgi:hypothetical protein